MSARSRPPAGLDAAGRSFWRSVLATYELSPVELVLLGQACRVVDLLDRADRELADADLTVFGSTGQPRTHPLVTSTSELRRVLEVLLRGLALPMPDETTGRRRSPAAAAAAQARWRGERGSVA
jgi:hypothetical protein